MSFTTTHFQTLFAYHWHVTQRLLEAAARLDPAAYHQDFAYGYGSIHGLFVHLRNTARAYRLSLETGRRHPHLDPNATPNLSAVQSALAEEQSAWQPLLDRLTAAEIEAPMEVVMRDGPHTIPRWHMLQQVILHGMQHQAELAQALTLRGQSPGDLDFLLFV